jgi:hypothetical protein
MVRWSYAPKMHGWYDFIDQNPYWNANSHSSWPRNEPHLHNLHVKAHTVIPQPRLPHRGVVLSGLPTTIMYAFFHLFYAFNTPRPSHSPSFHHTLVILSKQQTRSCRSQWPRSLRCMSTTARLLRSWVRIPPAACCVCCMLSGRGLCDQLITRPEESYRLRRVVVCDHETSWYEEAIARAGLDCRARETNNKHVHNPH